MRCALVEKMIPLLVSDDLSDEHATLLRRHLETCEPCRKLAAEYSEDQLWLRAFAATQFPEAMFDDLRDGVQKVIAKTEPQRRWIEWLTPRWNARVIMAASATLLLLAAAGIYLWRSQSGRSSSVMVKFDEPKQINNKQEERRVTEQPRDPKNTIDSQNHKRPAPSLNARFTKRKSLTLPMPQQELALPEQTEVAITEVPDGQEMLRIEIQTADPNIRIIWLTPINPNAPSNDMNTNR